MDSRAVASALNTDPKTLRRFLRSNASSVAPVGSGGRYAFDPSDLDTIRTEFAAWSEIDRKPRTPSTPTITTPRRPRTAHGADEAVWAEEGDIDLPNIRNPHVLRYVREVAEAQELRLMALMRQAGLTTDSRSSARV